MADGILMYIKMFMRVNGWATYLMIRKVLEHPSTTILTPSVISNGYFNVGQIMLASAWLQLRFQCTLNAVTIVISQCALSSQFQNCDIIVCYKLFC